MDLEYRILELNIEGVNIITNPYDFGCACIIQDYLLANDGNLEETRPGKFVVNLVDAVLYRMLEGKVLDFSVVNKISPSTKFFVYLRLRKWYADDLQYLNNLVQSTKIAGVNIDGSSSSEDKSTFYDLWYMLFKIHGVDPEKILSWKFETVANLVYLAEREKTREYIKRNPIFQ